MSIKSQEISDFIRSNNRPVSLEEPINDEGTTSMADMLVDTDAPPPEKGVMLESLKTDIKNTISKVLTPAEAITITQFFGLNGSGNLSVEEIGSKLELSRERVRQLRDKAILKLRRSVRGRLLENYIGSV